MCSHGICSGIGTSPVSILTMRCLFQQAGVCLHTSSFWPHASKRHRQHWLPGFWRLPRFGFCRNGARRAAGLRDDRLKGDELSCNLGCPDCTRKTSREEQTFGKAGMRLGPSPVHSCTRKLSTSASSALPNCKTSDQQQWSLTESCLGCLKQFENDPYESGDQGCSAKLAKPNSIGAQPGIAID